MGHGQMIWQRDQAVRLVTWGIRFFLTAALTASKTPGGYAPFALGCVAAAGPGAAAWQLWRGPAWVRCCFWTSRMRCRSSLRRC